MNELIKEKLGRHFSGQIMVQCFVSVGFSLKGKAFESVQDTDRSFLTSCSFQMIRRRDVPTLTPDTISSTVVRPETITSNPFPERQRATCQYEYRLNFRYTQSSHFFCAEDNIPIEND
jgi:hypothetical protein